MSQVKKIEVKLIKSVNGRIKSVKSSVSGLGLRKIGDVSVLESTPSVRGMIKKVIHLLSVKE